MVKMNVYYPFLLSGKDMSNLKTLLHKESKILLIKLWTLRQQI